MCDQFSGGYCIKFPSWVNCYSAIVFNLNMGLMLGDSAQRLKSKEGGVLFFLQEIILLVFSPKFQCPYMLGTCQKVETI